MFIIFFYIPCKNISRNIQLHPSKYPKCSCKAIFLRDLVQTLQVRKTFYRSKVSLTIFLGRSFFYRNIGGRTLPKQLGNAIFFIRLRRLFFYWFLFPFLKILNFIPSMQSRYFWIKIFSLWYSIITMKLELGNLVEIYTYNYIHRYLST